MTNLETIRGRLRSAGQEHVLRHWPQLTEGERARLLSECESLDLDLVARLARRVLEDLGPSPLDLEPPHVVHAAAGPLPEPIARASRELGIPEHHADRAREVFRGVGDRLLREGRVGFVLVAGGQATRLGFDRPKGCFPIGPVSRRTLFEFHASRVAAIGRRVGRTPLWFVLTSPSNDAETRQYFESQEYFGLPRDRVVLYPQETVPAFDRQGKLLLETPSSLFRNPSGHGGSLWALARSGFLKRCRAEGVEHLFYWQVDNPLVRVGDPLFLGFHHSVPAAGMSSKVVPKRSPEEKVGVLARHREAGGARTVCVEYSDLDVKLRDARGPGGELLYRAGNIAIHAFRVSFVESLTNGSLRLPWHRAEKKIRALSEAGAPVEIAGVKFETFVFDALPLSEETISVEVKREDEFAPVKNASGEDSPDSARAAIVRYYQRWFRKAGIEVGEEPHGPHAVEVSPAYAFDFEEFSRRRSELPSRVEGPLYLGD